LPSGLFRIVVLLFAATALEELAVGAGLVFATGISLWGRVEGRFTRLNLEFVLAKWVALLSWRLHRVTCFETGSIAL
jgi:hypothetical protein